MFEATRIVVNNIQCDQSQKYIQRGTHSVERNHVGEKSIMGSNAGN